MCDIKHRPDPPMGRTSQKCPVRDFTKRMPCLRMNISMNLPGGICLRSCVPTTELLLCGALLLSVGCVSLDKPASVQACATANTCSDDPTANDKKDAADAVLPDLASEPSAVPDDAGPDVGPDMPADKGDVAVVKQDVLGNEAGAIEVAPPTDRAPEVGRVDVGGPDLDSGIDIANNEVGTDEVGKDALIKDDLVYLDVGANDVWGPEAQPEVSKPDVSTAACASANPVSGNNYALGSTSAVCFVTCDDMQYGWGCSSFTETDRAIKVNGTSVKCGAALPAKMPGNYYYFEIAAGGHTWDAIHWSGTANTTCPAPSGGFVP